MQSWLREQSLSISGVLWMVLLGGRPGYCKPPAWVNEGWAEDAIPFVEGIYEDFNKEHGTNFKFK